MGLDKKIFILDKGERAGSFCDMTWVFFSNPKMVGNHGSVRL